MFKLIEALKNTDIPVPNKDTETFKIVRWGKNNRYWLRKFDGGYIFGDFVTGLNTHIFERNFKGEKLREAQERMKKTVELVEQKSTKMYDLSADKAKFFWNNARSVVQNSYLERKKVDHFNLKEYKSNLVILLYDNCGKIWTLQFIDREGNKRFLSGGKKKGCYFVIGSLENAEKAFICEGYATGATIHACSEVPVVVAFDACNLKPVAKAIREKYANLRIIFCADNDCYHESGINPGVEKAKKAAQAVDAKVIIPKFKDTSTHPTDFNDLFLLET